MSASFSDKRAHRLWTAGSAREFAELLHSEVRASVADVVTRFVPIDDVRLVVLGGSIPLAMASPVSDIDFVLVVDSIDAVRRAVAGEARVVFRLHPDGLLLAECVGMFENVEVDVQIVARARVHELLERVSGGQAALAQEELVVLSRLASGWPLLGDGNRLSDLWQSPWRHSLQLFCATREYVFALKAFEDAGEEARARPAMALHLGRLAAEYGYRAFFSSKGYTALGSKWMMLLSDTHPFSARHLAGNALGTSADHATLLFPSGEHATFGVTPYLDRVASFLTSVRAAMEQDQSMKIALRLCPQIYSVPAPARVSG